MRAALEFAISKRAVDDASRLLYALWRFWQIRGHLREGRAWAERVLAIPGAAPAARLRALEAAGGMSYWMADMAITERYYRESYELALAINDPPAHAHAAYNLSFVYNIGRTDIPRARKLLEEAIVIFRELGDRAAIGRAAWALAQSYGQGEASSDDLRQARRYALEALEHHRALGNRFDIAWDLHGVGLAAMKFGELDEADRAWRESMATFVAGSDSSGMVLMLSNFAELAKRRGDLERHDTLVGAWSALAERTGVGLATLWGPTEGRALARDIPPERRAAFDRGFVMKMEQAIAFALESVPANTI